MKPKKLNKKFTLNKRTVADLNLAEQDRIRAGWWLETAAWQTCFTWCGICYTKPNICTKTPDYTNGPGCD